MKPAGRYGHTLNILGSKIYVFGGQVDGHFFNDLIAFDLNALQDPTNKWELLIQDTSNAEPSQGPVPLGRTNHTVVTWNDKLYLYVGFLFHIMGNVNWVTDLEVPMASSGSTMYGPTIRGQMAGLSWTV